MKVKQYNKEQLQKMIQALKSFQGTTNERPWDKRYIRAYETQLKNLTEETPKQET